MNISTQERFDLYSSLKDRRFDHAVICTYEFGPLFFETDCLENFRALPENSNISVVLDRGVYERLISSDLNAMKQANLRYLLHPASFSTRGVFHPKLFLFATAKKGLLIVGSPNWTEPGLRTNAELVGYYTFEQDKQEEYLPLFQQAFAFLAAVAKESPGEAFCSHLSEIASYAPWLADELSAIDSLPVRLIHNIERPLWPQICDGLSDSVETLHIVAPYYDASPTILQRMHDDLKSCQINIYTQNHTTTLTKKWLQDPLVKEGKAKIHLCAYRDAEHRQSLHAKALAIVHGGSCRLAFGSANCSSAALLKKASQGNVEIMLLFSDVPKRNLNPKRLFDPIGDAEILTDEDMLVTASQEPTYPSSTPRYITLHEAIVVGQSIRCTVCASTDAENILFTELWAVLTLANQETHSLPLTHVEGVFYNALLTEEMVQKTLTASSAVHVERRIDHAGEDVVTSNTMLLTNLQDGESGVSLRSRRQLRQAEQSAAGFLLAWNDLINSGDDESLKDFLTFCNIPISVVRRLAFLRERPQWSPVAGMKPIEPKYLPWFKSLDEAAGAFINRHLTKLQGHLDYAALESAPNFMHIALSIAGVIEAQVERAAVTLENFGKTGSAIILPEEWSEWKKYFDRHYDRFEELMTSVTAYVKVLHEDEKAHDIAVVLQADLKSMREAIQYMLSLRERVEACRTQRMRITLPSGEHKTPMYNSTEAFQQNTFAPHNWSKYHAKITKLQAQLPH